jgi:ribosomal protein S18 acetylase RimI-like enzyme
MSPRIRAATAQDIGFLWDALGWAANWRGASEEKIGEDSFVAAYVRGWGRQGDAGFLAEDEDARPIGAAWYRLFAEDDHGYGYLSPEIPELSLAVHPEHRGRGTGTALLEALSERARTEGVSALSLSVEKDNPAIRLYERVGFERLRLNGGAWTMRLLFRQEEATDSK